ncbi:trypsin-like peptidase domain-containing protein [Streptomyces triculaminicus]|uniref:Trypsin-like peptidase domain-containing protein n=2 Tax=Streptomyces TaxID=1883 RepID=A0A939FQ14_9ACTN|nr:MULTISPECIES: serine protease [Streptomyces]MBO0654784.1 trypsin-like peptidase domain-containing protein [Streptomyces triculaminicus]QSY51313.1 trypsin-like peptidase domain-containing protein [Streptomyces griseocarneus]
MRRPLVGALTTLLLAGAGVAGAGTATAATPQGDSPAAPAKAAPASAQAASAQAVSATGPAAATKPKAVDFAGTVALSNCSGSLIRLPGSGDNDPALVLSNGHCLETGMPGAGEVITDQPSSRTFSLLNSTAGKVATLRATKVSYATMTDTDISLYELNTTYARIKQQYGINALSLSADHPTAGTAIKVVSGYWKRIYSCNADGFVHELREGDWTWKDSLRYTPSCNTIGGTSGSPVVDANTGKVVAVNNTGNESGERCTMNNPCEVDENGQVTVRKGINYAQQTYGIAKCFAAGNKLDLDLPGCELPRPTEEEAPLG